MKQIVQYNITTRAELKIIYYRLCGRSIDGMALNCILVHLE